MAKEMNFEALNASLRMIDKRGELAFEQAKAEGTLTDQQEKFSALISDEAFLEKFFAADSAEEVKALFGENGLDLSEEEINAFGKYIADVSKKLIENGGEISEEELEQIAGGGLAESLGEEMSNASTAQTLLVVPGLTGGMFAGAIGGFKLGGAIGTCICPGPGTAIGGVVGIIIGGVGGAIGGTVGSWKLGEALPKVGKWIKSWF